MDYCASAISPDCLMQHEWTKKMSEETETTSDNSVKCISFDLGKHEFCVDIMVVKEIRGWSKPTPLPHSPDFVCGAINLRGIVLPIIDFSMRMDLPPTVPDESYVTIILEVGDQVFGIVVDAVSDIVTLDFNQLQRPPELESSVSESCLLGIIARENSMMRVINVNALFPRQLIAAA